MSDTTIVLASMRLDALLSNSWLSGGSGQTFFRGNLSFKPYADPEPAPLQKTGPVEIGVHLHWHLPRAFGQVRFDTRSPDGDPPEESPQPAVPVAPNRWLAVRYHHPEGRDPGEAPDVAGWLVQSDYTSGSDEGNSTHIGHGRWLGRSIDLSTPDWSEPADITSPFAPLTVLGPGLATFATFQPYCRNVFSLHDPLTDPGRQDAAPGTLSSGLLSYLVLGWHSEPTDDLTSPEEALAVLDFHGHPLPGTPRERLTRLLHHHGAAAPDITTDKARTLCQGLVLALPWKKDDATVLDGRRPANTPESVRVAVGHDMADAMDCLVTNSLPDTDDGRQRAQAVRALHTGRLELADHAVPTKDTTTLRARQAVLDAAHHRDWFRAEPTGLRWLLTAAPDGGGNSAGGSGTDPALKPLLDELNTAQRALDAADYTLSGLRRRALDLWWLTATLTDPGLAGKAREAAPAAATAFTTARSEREDLLRRRRTAHRALSDKLTDPAFQGIRLTGAPTEPFWQPLDPGLVIRGANHPHDRTLRENVDVFRHLTDVVTTATTGRHICEAPSAVPAPPHLDWALRTAPDSAAVTTLLRELYVLHAATGHLRHTTPAPGKLLSDLAGGGQPLLTFGAGQKPPAYAAVWEQPWNPLTVHWMLRTHPLKYEDGSTAYWSFDGDRRTLAPAARPYVTALHDGDGDDPGHFTLLGRSLLAPVPLYTLRRRVDAYRATYPSGRAADSFTAFQDLVAGWDLTSATLTGVHAALSHRVSAVPTPHTAQDAPPPGTPADARGHTWPSPVQGTGTHQYVHAEHFRFEHLVVVDTFGRSARVIQAGDPVIGDDSYPIGRARSVRPPFTVTDHNPRRFLQLPPRLARPARLCLTALEPTVPFPPAPGPIGHPAGDATTPEAPTPVTGWLLVRNTDDPARFTIDVYAPDGSPLGTLRRAGPSADSRRLAVTWRPLPDSPHLTPDSVHGKGFDGYGPLASFVRSLLDTDPDGIAAGHPAAGGPAASGKPDALAALATVLDSALSATHPPPPVTAGVAMTAGRLLALVHLRAHLETDGPPPIDPADPTDWNKPPEQCADPHADTRHWPVRLGTATDLRCGLIGYFTTGDCSTLFTDHAPTAGGYAQPIAAGDTGDPSAVTVTAHPRRTDGEPPGAAHVLLLMDPYQDVHAHTDILPVQTLRIPRAETDRYLDALRLAVPLGPALAHALTDAATGRTRLTLPAPAPAGSWDLTLRTTDSRHPWQHTQLTAGDPQPVLRPTLPTAHSGHLTYSRKDPGT